MNEQGLVRHTFAPVFDSASRVLILGTMPSPVSRANGFYYSHPQNRFWHILAKLLLQPVPGTPEEKRAFLLMHGIALWDVLASCEIEGASDASIQKPTANDLRVILARADIRALFTTGQKAFALYRRLCQPATGLDAIPLPSTSPANARMSIEVLAESYRRILPYLAP